MAYKKYSDLTLLSLPKKELLEHLRCAEHNRDVAEQTLEQQAVAVKDYVPVRHGHWITGLCFSQGTYDYLEYDKKCSVCEKYSRDFSTYCPNCGAKMDEEVY